MKIDPYKNQQRWENWKENNFSQTPEGIKKEDWKLLIEFLKDMELGLNTPIGRKGKRDAGTLLNLSSHNKLFLDNFKKPLLKLTKKDLHDLEQKISQGKILKKNGQKYTAFGNYIKDFQVFWNWMVRTKKVSENITEDISCKTDKPAWVYLTEEQAKQFFNSMTLDYRAICWFMYDTGFRVTEAINIKVQDFSEDFEQVSLSDEASKTFGRSINLKLSRDLIKEYVRVHELKPEDPFIQKQPFAINKYLRYHCKKMFGDGVSHPKSKGKYPNFTLYDIRHNSSCFWLNRYPTHKGLMYRMGWKNANKIEYYSEMLGVRDELTDSDMVLSEDRDKIYKLEGELKDLKQKFVKFQSEFLKALRQEAIKVNKSKFETAIEVLSH